MCVPLSVYKDLFSPNLVCIKEVDNCKHYKCKDNITNFSTLVFRCRSGRKVSEFHWADTRRDTRLVQHQIFISQRRTFWIVNLNCLGVFSISLNASRCALAVCHQWVHVHRSPGYGLPTDVCGSTLPLRQEGNERPQDQCLCSHVHCPLRWERITFFES